MPPRELKLVAATAAYGSTTVLRDISLTVAPGSYAVIVGPSGSGKSTLLHAVAGLMPLSSGRVILGERDITGLDPGKRNIAFVFQSYALYPHFSVFDNMAFPLRLARLDKAQVARKVAQTAELLGIGQLVQRFPRELSGGERQRVALGRALVRDPALLLLDEPLSNLDAQLRLRMRRELKQLQRRLGLTVLHVTHDQAEALALGDSVVVLSAGEMQQHGAPQELLRRPANSFVASFVGTPPHNLASGRLLLRDAGLWLLLDGQEYELPPGKYHWREGWPRSAAVEIAVPASACKLQPTAGNISRVGLEGEIVTVEETHGVRLVSFETHSHLWSALCTAESHNLVAGKRVSVSFPLNEIRLFDALCGAAVLQ
jgi:ABC-type sugar transport system ATPase subunit